MGQATLSRDIRDLGLVKIRRGYVLPQAKFPSEPTLPPVSRLVREFVLEVRPAQNLFVMKTSVAARNPWLPLWTAKTGRKPLAPIAGDDTILIVCPDKKAANRLASRIQEMLA